MNFSMEIPLDTVELYDGFLNLMEQADYNNNRVVLSNRNITISQRKDNIDFISNSYPPTKSPTLFNQTKFISMNLEADSSPTTNVQSQTLELSNVSKLSSNEFVNIRDFEQFDDDFEDYDNYNNFNHFNDELNDTSSIISYDDSESSDPCMLFPIPNQNASNCNLQESSSYQQKDSEPTTNNPVVPGLFPKMDIEDEDQFLPFDKLPLNPSFIVP